jgi:hypothetical protein
LIYKLLHRKQGREKERLSMRWWRENTHDLQPFFFVENNNEERDSNRDSGEKTHMTHTLLLYRKQQ